MKIRITEDKVKDSHRIIVQGDKGPEIVPSVILFVKDQIVESNDTDLPDDRLAKLVGYGYAEIV